jgi:hypothetical protein
MKKKRFLITFLIFLLLVNIVIAAEFGFREFKDSISDVFENIHELFKKRYVVWGSMMVILYILVYNALLAAAKNVRIFEGEGGVGVNSPGKMVCGSFTGLFILALIYYERTIGFDRIISGLASFGLFGGFVILGGFFFFIRALIKSNES